MAKYFFEQDFRRVNTGTGQRRDITIRIEVDSPNVNRGDYGRIAFQELKKKPGAGFLSGWTPWKLMDNRIVGDDVPEEIFEPVDTIELPLNDMVELPLDPVTEIMDTMEGEGEIVTPEDLSDMLPEYEEAAPLEIPVPAPHNRDGAIERLKKYSRHKIKNVYDKPDFPIDAVDVLQPGFEYADWSEERVSQLWKRS